MNKFTHFTSAARALIVFASICFLAACSKPVTKEELVGVYRPISEGGSYTSIFVFSDGTGSIGIPFKKGQLANYFLSEDGKSLTVSGLNFSVTRSGKKLSIATSDGEKYILKESTPERYLPNNLPSMFVGKWLNVYKNEDENRIQYVLSNRSPDGTSEVEMVTVYHNNKTFSKQTWTEKYGVEDGLFWYSEEEDEISFYKILDVSPDKISLVDYELDDWFETEQRAQGDDWAVIPDDYKKQLAKSQLNAIEKNLKHITIAGQQYMLEEGASSADYAQLVGVFFDASDIPSIAGENYSDITIHESGGETTVTTSDGSTISYAY